MKIISRIGLLLLCMVTIFGAVAASVPYSRVEAAGRDIFEIEAELTDYRNQLKTLQAELAKMSKDIATLEGKSGETAALIQQYLAEIEVLEKEIEDNTAIMESYDLKRAEVLSEKFAIEEDYAYRVEMYKKLMQFIYENSTTNMFEMLFSSDSISDFLTKRDHFNDIMAAANTLMKEIEASIADLEALDSELAEAQNKYSTYLSDLARSQVELDTKVKEFETIAKDLNLDAESLTGKYTEKVQKSNELKAIIKKLEEEQMAYYNAHSDFRSPLDNGTFYISSNYGWRGDPFNGNRTFHKGIDMAAARGTPIHAIADGTVTRASWYSTFGECVIIYHGNNLYSLYAHCDNTSKSRPVYEVKVGDYVKKGQVVAYVGTTGRSTGNHLHFQMYDPRISKPNSGNTLNPKDYLPSWVFG